jgi:uncharacterized protein YlaI
LEKGIENLKESLFLGKAVLKKINKKIDFRQRHGKRNFKPVQAH